MFAMLGRSRIGRFLVIVAVSLVTSLNSSEAYSFSTPGNVIVVDQDAPGPGEDGLSWETAFRFLQDAIEALDPQVEGIDEIWVAAGTYYPDESIANPGGTGDIGDHFTVKADSSYYGGFAGGEEERIQRDARKNVTILSGAIDAGVHSTTIVRWQSGGFQESRLEGFDSRSPRAGTPTPSVAPCRSGGSLRPSSWTAPS